MPKGDHMSTLTKDEQIAFYKEWIAALRSGEYLQGKNHLHDYYSEHFTDGNPTVHEYCCLGVACEIALKKDWLRRESHNHTEDAYYYHGSVLSTDLRDFRYVINLNDREEKILISMNDGRSADGDMEPKSFDEIADYIEQQILPRIEGA